MKAVITRVSSASVTIRGEVVGAIGEGLLLLLGVAQGDTEQDVEYLAGKTADLRIFADADGKMNLSVRERGGAVLVVSQFTLLGDVRKGRRPSFIQAAPPEAAAALYEAMATRLREMGLAVSTGVFRADMQVASVNDGPVTILIDSRER